MNCSESFWILPLGNRTSSCVSNDQLSTSSSSQREQCTRNSSSTAILLFIIPETSSSTDSGDIKYDHYSSISNFLEGLPILWDKTKHECGCIYGVKASTCIYIAPKLHCQMINIHILTNDIVSPSRIIKFKQISTTPQVQAPPPDPLSTPSPPPPLVSASPPTIPPASATSTTPHRAPDTAVESALH